MPKLQWQHYALILMALINVIVIASLQWILTNTNNISHVASKQPERLLLDRKEPIDINPNSTVASDILTLWHNPKRCEVCIHLRGGARCPRPSLVGRLSGESIAMLQWTESIPTASNNSNTTGNTTMYCGSYTNSWLSPGIYFLELIIIHCRDFGMQTLNKIRSTNYTKNDILLWRNFDFTHVCVEDPPRHRITTNSTYITIEEHGMAGQGNGFWLHNRHKNNSKSPWFTRYQPQGCISKTASALPCIAPMDNSRIEEYKFTWIGNEWIKDVGALQIDLNITSPASIYSVGKMYAEPISGEFDEKSTKFANDRRYLDNEYVLIPDLSIFMPVLHQGDSHSWHLIKALYRLNLGHRFVFAQLLFPTDDASFFKNCTSNAIALLSLLRLDNGH
jgi:hypothetical protein